MKMIGIKTRAALDIGMPNLCRVLSYRLGLRLGLNAAQRLRVLPPKAPFFRQPEVLEATQVSNDQWKDEASYFGWFSLPLGGKPPNWYLNPFSGKAISCARRHWWEIPEFDPEIGDIKAIWETSRFDWVLAHALQGSAGDGKAIDRLNAWLEDWCRHNPPYIGPNWKCSQEASIRVMHLAMSAILLKQDCSPQSGLLDLICVHLQRIAPTIQYAVSQDNNHGTSEAAALFIGGSWLQNISGESLATKWENAGRRWLENRVQRLIAHDGSFSQYSINYHRLLLDTLSMVEIWRRKAGRKEFSLKFKSRCKAAVKWLHAFIDPETGDVPNLGSNDGARLLPICSTGFRDFRPSVQLGAALFLGESAYSEGPWNEPMRRLGIPAPNKLIPDIGSKLFDQGGYARLRSGDARVFIRYPRFRFRPGHADALHVDLWIGTNNILRDGGSFSYAADTVEQKYFSGTASHNTVQFDDRDQMPQLNRFLYGGWLKTKNLESAFKEGNEERFLASCRDWRGAEHQRRVILKKSILLVDDWISGFRNKAVLRWRLMPGDWRYIQGTWQLGSVVLRVHSDMPISRMELVEGLESRYYLKRDPIPVLEVESNHPGHFKTELTWSSPIQLN